MAESNCKKSTHENEKTGLTIVNVIDPSSLPIDMFSKRHCKVILNIVNKDILRQNTLEHPFKRIRNGR